MRSLAAGAAVLVTAVSIGATVDAGAELSAPLTNAAATNAAATNAAASRHTVGHGDTLYSIAMRYGTDVADLVARNALVEGDEIRIGQVLLVPSTASLERQLAGSVSIRYTVAAGDTLNAIARRFGTSATALATANGVANPDAIAVGQVLTVPMSTRAGLAGGTVSTVLAPNGIMDAGLTTPGGPPVPTTPPPPLPPVNPTPSVPSTPTRLPVSLFGSTATDPARLALVPVFDRWADAYQVPRELLKGLAFVESGWRADARSSVGAVGIGQLMPDTSRWLATTIMGEPSLDPTRPEDNIRMTARYLRYLLDRTPTENIAIGSYYQGIGSVTRDGLKPGTLSYITRVQTARAAFG